MSTDKPDRPATIKAAWPAEFTVEFGDDCNSNFVISSFAGQMIRGRWSLSVLFARDGGGPDVGQAMSAMPEHPGLRLKISPQQGKALLYDPLEKDKKLLEKVSNVRKKAMLTGNVETTFVPETPYTLDVDRMKTLCSQIADMQGWGKICGVPKGRIPTAKEIDKMPGELLNDMGNSNRHKPIYAKDYDAWARGLEQVGA